MGHLTSQDNNPSRLRYMDRCFSIGSKEKTFNRSTLWAVVFDELRKLRRYRDQSLGQYKFFIRRNRATSYKSRYLFVTIKNCPSDSIKSRINAKYSHVIISSNVLSISF